MYHRFKSSGGFDSSGCWILRLRSSYLKQKTSRNIRIILTNVITKIQVVSQYEYVMYTCKHKENILIYSYDFFPQIIIFFWLWFPVVNYLKIISYIHILLLSVRITLLISSVKFVKTLLIVSNKVEILNTYRVNDFLRLQPSILSKQWKYFQLCSLGEVSSLGYEAISELQLLSFIFSISLTIFFTNFQINNMPKNYCVSFGILRCICANVFRTCIKFAQHPIKIHFENEDKDYIKNH